MATPGGVYEKVISNAQEAKALDSRLIGVTPHNEGEAVFIAYISILSVVVSSNTAIAIERSPDMLFI
ncbi:hypothetical protein G7B40_031765 [Aetokthonos hydrillicola Thurmond2011]|jgi:hypothetical protein|uniref:Uncharacterized protein n=1 Tax=Aetokthonos hydrillicola Thurmond2011 TaxID=2712845 RepID=A0AAP5MBC5_9CYAN|nr:hypothetical protein [Aetokthonos hydrillicola]MBO3463580.1 hypothetical protein [Aetokthonos hydrillicola CCALA 1050]MBW4585388.1 hypothetical protein [Aetokthonos hydrillicola CCALA 1050]MDR9899105.1 hypothetical protein [Aetokthonos hydrillicola Thurmond2011]